MRVALVYDRVNKWGGAERLLLALHRLWPNAPLYTAVYHPQAAPWAKEFKVIPSFLNRFPLAKRHHELIPFLMPLAFESFDFKGYDLVISITSEAAKGIITRPETPHLCYCLTPTRYLWSGRKDYFQSRTSRFLARPVVNYLQRWDKIAAQRPDAYLAISKNVQRRIKKYYGRESKVIYPPVDIRKWKGQKKPQSGQYFLMVGRLDLGKKVDLVVKAFNQLSWPLKIIGQGRLVGKLKRMAQKNIEFLGHLTDDQVLSYYQNCQAVIFPQTEDFGLVPLEAQACGRPVIAYRNGGVLETIIEGKTGLFFSPQTVEALVKTIRNFRTAQFNATACRQNALKFGQGKFEKEFKQFVLEKWKNIRN